MLMRETELRVDVYANASIHLFGSTSETRAKGRRDRLLRRKGTLLYLTALNTDAEMKQSSAWMCVMEPSLDASS